MKRCYFCDAEIEGSGHPFKIGLQEEIICEECRVKSVNRTRAVEEGNRISGLGRDDPSKGPSA